MTVTEREEKQHAVTWLSVRESTTYVQCGPSQLYAAVRRGALKAGRVGRRLRFRRQWLDDWVEKEGRDARRT